MAEASAVPPASARNLVQVILQRLARVKNSRVAEAIGKDESQVSRIVAGDSGIKLADLYPFLEALDLKVVDRSKVCVDRSVFEAYRTLAAKAMTEPESLQWGDE